MERNFFSQIHSAQIPSLPPLVSIQLTLTRFPSAPANLGQEEWVFLFFRAKNSHWAALAWATMLGRTFIPGLPRSSSAFWVTTTTPEHAASFWNPTPPKSQGFNNGKNLLPAQSVSFQFPWKYKQPGLLPDWNMIPESSYSSHFHSSFPCCLPYPSPSICRDKGENFITTGLCPRIRGKTKQGKQWRQMKHRRTNYIESA